MIEKDNTVHSIFSWKKKIIEFVFPGSALSCPKIVHDLSEAPLTSPPPFEETNSQSKPSFFPKCELYSHSVFISSLDSKRLEKIAWSSLQKSGLCPGELVSEEDVTCLPCLLSSPYPLREQNRADSA